MLGHLPLNSAALNSLEDITLWRLIRGFILYITQKVGINFER